MEGNEQYWFHYKDGDTKFRKKADKTGSTISSTINLKCRVIGVCFLTKNLQYTHYNNCVKCILDSGAHQITLQTKKCRGLQENVTSYEDFYGQSGKLILVMKKSGQRYHQHGFSKEPWHGIILSVSILQYIVASKNA